MDNDQLLEKIKELEDTIEFLSFRQNLLFSNTSTDRILYEYDITKEQYNKIMDLMDEYRASIDENKKVTHGSFEDRVYEIVPQHGGNYHFVESLTRSFWENGRWEEVFDKLYKDMPKYKYLKKGI